MIEGLRNVREIISHKNCPDGIASALICHDALPGASVRFVMYGESDYTDLPVQEGMLFVDIIPPKDRAEQFAQAGAIVLDHHLHAKDVVAQFGARGRFADERERPGVSGALLAYDHVWHPLMSGKVAGASGVREFAELVGVRDTWQTQDPRWTEACANAEGLLLHGFDGLASNPPWKALGPFMKVGRALFRRKLRAAQESAKRAHIRGPYAFTNDRYASDFAEALREQGSPAEVAVAFSYQGQTDGSLQLVYSLRTIQGDRDVGELAKANGGGGHTKAAGFSVKLWKISDPVSLFLKLAP